MTLTAVNPGSTGASQRQEVTPSGTQPETKAHKKLTKAAEEFEGLLISQLLSDFKMGLTADGGDAPLAGSDTLNSLAVQTLSGAMAGRGGFGIGKMLVHQLEPGVDRGRQNIVGGKIKTTSRG